MPMPAAWQEGYDAAGEDDERPLRERCPYDETSADAEMWWRGVSAAQHEQMEAIAAVHADLDAFGDA